MGNAHIRIFSAAVEGVTQNYTCPKCPAVKTKGCRDKSCAGSPSADPELLSERSKLQNIVIV